MRDLFGPDNNQEQREQIYNFINKFLVELVEKTKDKTNCSKLIDIFIILFEIDDYQINLEAVKNLITRKSIQINEINEKHRMKIDKIDKIEFNLKN